MIHKVHLASFPDELQIPATLESRFWYDESGRTLCFEGFMSKAVYDQLERLSSDYDYQRALERLFRDSTPEEPAADLRATRRYLLAALAVTGLLTGGVTLAWLLATSAGG